MTDARRSLGDDAAGVWTCGTGLLVPPGDTLTYNLGDDGSVLISKELKPSRILCGRVYLVVTGSINAKNGKKSCVQAETSLFCKHGVELIKAQQDLYQLDLYRTNELQRARFWCAGSKMYVLLAFIFALVRAQLDTTAAWPTFLNDSQRTGRSVFMGPIDPQVISTTIWRSAEYHKVAAETKEAGNSSSGVQSPVVISGPAYGRPRLIIFGSRDGFVRAIDDSGNMVWNYKTGGSIYGGVALGVGGNVFFGSSDGKFYGMRMPVAPGGTLTPIFVFPTESAIYTSPLLLPNAVVVLALSNYTVCAISTVSGALLWSTRLEASTQPLQYCAAYDQSRGIIYQPVGSLVAAINAISGKIECYFHSDDYIIMTVAVGKKYIVFTSQSGYVYWLDKSSVDLCNGAVSDVNNAIWEGVSYMRLNHNAPSCSTFTQFSTQALFDDDSVGIANQRYIYRLLGKEMDETICKDKDTYKNLNPRWQYFDW